MCAECHSTGLRKSYDADRDRYATTWSEISVGCEACHGKGPITSPGLARNRAGGHSAGKRIAAKACSLAWMSGKGSYGRTIQPAEMFGATSRPILYARKLKPAGAAMRAAASCPRHGRRGTGFRDTHAIAAHSRERSTGLTAKCGTPPRPTTTSVQAEQDVCGRRNLQQLSRSSQRQAEDCRRGRLPPMPRVRSLRRVETQPSSTNECRAELRFVPHAGRTYMVIDTRHDHSLRVRGPDLSVKYGTPNACTDCHTDKPAQWAAGCGRPLVRLRSQRLQTYVEAFASASANRANARNFSRGSPAIPTLPMSRARMR